MFSTSNSITHSIIIDYDTAGYPFQKALAAQVFRVPVLEKLHLSWQRKTKRELLTHADNLQLRDVMQRLETGSLFYKIYYAWVNEVLARHYGYEISYSAHPKMRVHLAGTGSVSNFHRDYDVTKRELQVNCYLPFTNVRDSNTLWVESDYGLQDYRPVNLNYGQALLWDGGFLTHGTVKNETEYTRVSCDFRFQPKQPWIPEPPWSEILAGRKTGMANTPAAHQSNGYHMR